MSFTFNKQAEFKPLSIGDYEAYLEEYKYDTTTTGKNLIRLKFRIRDDIEQEGKNRVVNDAVWSKKDNNEEYIMFKIMQLIGAVDPNLEDGHTFKDLNDALDFCKGKPIKIYVAQRTNNTNGNIENDVGKYKSSEKKFNSLNLNKDPNDVTTYEVTDDDDLPF